MNLNKEILIRDFILEDENKFLMACDINDYFKNITDGMLKEIGVKLAAEFNERNHTNINCIDAAGMANYHYAKMSIGNDYVITMEFSYYFKLYRITLSHTKTGYDADNSSHVKAREFFQVKYPSDSTFEKWYICGVKINNFNLNNNGDYIDLFDLYHDKNSKQRQCFDKIFEKPESVILDLINAIE